MRLAIDPGLDTGWAVLDGANTLLACGLGDPSEARKFLPCSTKGVPVIIERPVIHKHTPDPDNIITLAITVGRYTEMFFEYEVEHIRPHTWKGSLDPDICLMRIVASLSDAERALLFERISPLAPRTPLTGSRQSLAAGTRHNVIDAVGLAKWSTKRARACVF